MSAYIVSKAHIDTLVSARAVLPAYDHCASSIDPDAAGAMLWRENYKSVGYRYDERHGGQDDTPEYRHATVRLNLRSVPTLVALFKALDCYEYQSNEHPGWRESEAFRFCDYLRSALVRLLPGYRDAPWNIQDAQQAESA